MLIPLIVSVFVLLTVRVLARPADSSETVPAITRMLNRWVASIFKVLLVPSIVMVLVPAVNVDPAPEVSQLPWTVHDPLVSVIVPDAPPVIVTSVNVAGLALAVRVPPLGTTRFEPPEIVWSAVARVPETVSVWLMSVALRIVIVPLVVRS